MQARHRLQNQLNLGLSSEFSTLSSGTDETPAPDATEMTEIKAMAKAFNSFRRRRDAIDAIRQSEYEALRTTTANISSASLTKTDLPKPPQGK